MNASEIDWEKAEIVRVINDNICRALTKDEQLIYSTMQQDSTLLVINPNDSVMDDFGNGRSYKWENARWTGALKKIDDR